VSFLVKQQGEMIDSVFDNILEAKDYVEKAEQNLAKEKKNVKKSKKKMCCIILIGIIVLGLVLTPIIIKVTKKS
jgi:t-SNARE complex subunit (syntaxin)